MTKLIIYTGLIALIVILAACGSNTTGTTTTSTSTTQTSTTTSTTTTTTATYQTLAAAGQTVYSSNCAGCHGNSGQGLGAPALWGSGALLAKYNNASALLNFISANMPKNAPGSLSHQQYINVLCYILVQGNQVTGTNAFNESQLGSITLK